MDPLDETPGNIPEQLDRACSAFDNTGVATSHADPFYPLEEDVFSLAALQSNLVQEPSFNVHSDLQMPTPIPSQVQSFEQDLPAPEEPSLQHAFGSEPVQEKASGVVPMDAFSLPNSLSASVGVCNGKSSPAQKNSSLAIPLMPVTKVYNSVLYTTSPVSLVSGGVPKEEVKGETSPSRSDSSLAIPLRASIRRRRYRPRRRRNSLSRPAGIGNPWTAEGAPERAPRDSVVVKGEHMLGHRLFEVAQKEGEALCDKLIQNVCDFTENNKANERLRLQDLASENEQEFSPRTASRIEARLSRHKKDVFIAALAQQIKNLCEDLCVLKSVAANYVPGVMEVDDIKPGDTVQSHDLSVSAVASASISSPKRS